MRKDIRKHCSFVAALLLIAIGGCSQDVSHNEFVMCPGASIIVERKGESFQIDAETLLRRVVQIGPTKTIVNLQPRRSRWNGSLGLSTAHGGLTGPHIVAEEALQYFYSVDELQYWLSDLSYRDRVAYTSDGLVVKWEYQVKSADAIGPDAALTFEVYQVFVNGKKPVHLAGSHDEFFRKISIPAMTCASPIPYDASPPGTLNGRKYSGRAVDFLRERRISPDRIEKLLTSSDKSESKGEVTHYAPGDQPYLFSATTDASGTVVSIQ